MLAPADRQCLQGVLARRGIRLGKDSPFECGDDLKVVLPFGRQRVPREPLPERLPRYCGVDQPRHTTRTRLPAADQLAHGLLADEEVSIDLCSHFEP